MARRKRRSSPKTRTRTRTVTKYKSRGSSGPSLNTLAIAAFGYGGVREKISSFVAPYANQFLGAAGNVAEELGLGLVHYYAAKKVKNKMAKAFFTAGLVVEASRAGQALVGMSLSPKTSNNNNIVLVK